MEESPLKANSAEDTSPGPAESSPRRSRKLAYIIGIVGIVLTIAMAVAVFVWGDEIEHLKQYGYLGAFIISVLGGATIIIPVPMLAVVFALGAAMSDPWAAVPLFVAAALGELVGAMTIYMTGHGAGRAISSSKGRLQATYERMLRLMERRGPLTLFIVASVINPFFYPAALAAGALRFGVKRYIFIVLAGKLIKCATVVYAGYFGLKGIFRAIGVDI